MSDRISLIQFLKQMPLNELPGWALEERKDSLPSDNLSREKWLDKYRKMEKEREAEDKEMAIRLAKELTGGRKDFEKAFLELAKITVPAFRTYGLLRRPPPTPIVLGAPKKISNEDDQALVAYVDECVEKGEGKRKTCRIVAEAFTNNGFPITEDSLYARYKMLKRKVSNPE